MLVALFAAACNETNLPTAPLGPTPIPAGPVATLSGIVRDRASGAPFGPALVSCQTARQVVNMQTRNDLVGGYGFSGLKPGKAALQIYAQGQRAPQIFSVDLQEGANTFDPGIVVQHGQPATLSGFVTFADGRPSPAVYFACQGKWTRLADDGSYLLPGLESGTWDAAVSWGDYGANEFPLTITLGAGINLVNVTIPAVP